MTALYLQVSVHPPPLTPPTRGGGKTFPSPRWGRLGGGAELLHLQIVCHQDYFPPASILARVIADNHSVLQTVHPRFELKLLLVWAIRSLRRISGSVVPPTCRLAPCQG